MQDRLTVAAAVAIACLLAGGEWLWRADTAIYDRLLAGHSKPAPDDIVIVAVDDHSLAMIGRWPWPRRTHAELVDLLTRAGVRAIVFDIAFGEPSTREDDDRFAAALRRSGRVVLPVLFERGAHGTPVEALPLPALSEAAAAVGHVDVEVDADGVARSLYLQAGVGHPHWPALSLAALLRDGAGAAARPASPADAATFAWVRERQVLIPFTGGAGHYVTVPYVDVLRGAIPAAEFEGATVFVGATAAGLADIVTTPLSANQPLAGVELVAGTFDGIRSANTIAYLGSIPAVMLAGLVTFGLVTVSRSRPIAGAAAVVVIPLAMSWLLLRLLHIWSGPAAAIAASVLGCGAAFWQAQRTEGRPGQQARSRAAVALGSVQEAVLTIDARERVEYVNPIAEQWSGVTAAEAQGQKVSSVLPSWTRTCVRTPMRVLPGPGASRGSPSDAAASGARCAARWWRISTPRVRRRAW
jgi:CHASE2 domain-containing sensor protein